jgi:hypothetical protein
LRDSRPPYGKPLRGVLPEVHLFRRSVNSPPPSEPTPDEIASGPGRWAVGVSEEGKASPSTGTSGRRLSARGSGPSLLHDADRSEVAQACSGVEA